MPPIVPGFTNAALRMETPINSSSSLEQTTHLPAEGGTTSGFVVPVAAGGSRRWGRPPGREEGLPIQFRKPDTKSFVGGTIANARREDRVNTRPRRGASPPAQGWSAFFGPTLGHCRVPANPEGVAAYRHA